MCPNHAGHGAPVSTTLGTTKEALPRFTERIAICLFWRALTSLCSIIPPRPSRNKTWQGRERDSPPGGPGFRMCLAWSGLPSPGFSGLFRSSDASDGPAAQRRRGIQPLEERGRMPRLRCTLNTYRFSNLGSRFMEVTSPVGRALPDTIETKPAVASGRGLPTCWEDVPHVKHPD